MVDPEKIRQKLKYLESSLAYLRKLAALSQDEFSGDFRNVDSAIHRLQTSIEAMADIAGHIIARYRYGTPETMADNFRILAEQGIVDVEDLPTLVAMCKFRNRVVHVYAEIDEGEVYRIVTHNLSDIERFIGIVAERFL